MKKTFEKRALLCAFLILIFAVAGNTWLNLNNFNRDYRNSMLLRCREVAANLQTVIDNDLVGGMPLVNLQGINARCRRVVGTDPDIAYCLIEDARGVPIFCNDPSFHSVAGARRLSFLNRFTAFLAVPALGKVFDVSAPIFSPGHHLAGRIRLGVPVSALNAHLSPYLFRSLGILGLGFLAVFSLFALFFRRDMIHPIRQLCSVARGITSGDFNVHVPSMPSRDFAALGTALQEMAASLKQRDEKIQESYRELEETNLLLQHSYEMQEQISADLKRSKEMYRVLFDNASDAIVVSDQEDRVRLFNKRAEEFFGLSGEEVVGKSLFQVFEQTHGELGLHYRLYRDLLDRGYLETELRYLRAHDLQSVVGWLRASVIRGNSGTFWVQAIFRDVTRERETKDNLRQSAKELERLNRMKDSFLGVASHELKTPLTVILGYAELILAERVSVVESSILDMVRHIADAAERLSDIVRDMLDVSMLDDKRVQLKTRKVQVNDLVRKVVEEADVLFHQRDQSLEVKLDPSLPQIACDSTRILQALTHLVSNAVKFTPDGGAVSIETRTVESFRSPAADFEGNGVVRTIDTQLHPYIEIAIRDTGIGIAEKDQLHIFDKFYEAGSIEEHFTGKVAFKGRGTGLGLTIVKGIVDLHGGEIWVESPGQNPLSCPGSVFYLLLPIS